MNTSKLIAVFLAVFAITSHADDAATLVTQISGWSTGTGTLTAVANGNTVTVTGTKTGVSTQYSLNIDAGVNVIWKAELINSSYGYNRLIYLSGTGSFEMEDGILEAMSPAIHNSSTGTVNIRGGKVLSTYNSAAVRNESTGMVNISGGIVSATSNGLAVENNSTGEVNISGGEVSATTVYAVRNESTGKITVSGTTTKVTSANVSSSYGTIYNSIGTIEITGGTVFAYGTKKTPTQSATRS